IAPHIAFQHHERWDGSGYPRRLSRNKITEYARIVAVADVFDALSSPRSYRKPYTIKEVITIMSRLSDTYFDPLILKSFLTNFTR
ncbi:MAG: HD-GYP domain-containing protein, partial [Chitinophagales bacterium]